MQLHQLMQQTPNDISNYVTQNEQHVLQQMLENIGAVDSQLREAVTFQLFAFCLQEDLFSQQGKQWVMEQILSNQLLIENIQTISDDVFKRSGSALWLTQLVKYDSSLNEAQYTELFEQAIEALRLEKDSRGFIDQEKGWADAISVKTDLCAALLQHPHFKEAFSAKLLHAIASVVWNEQVFVNNEDERFIKVIMLLIQKGIDEALFIEWVEQIFDKLEYFSYEVGYTPQWFVARTNILQLMKTQYFHLKFSHQYDQLRATTSIFIQKWLKLS